MGKFVPRKSGYVIGLVVASLVGGLVSAAALAAIPDASGLIHGCYNTKSGAMKVIDGSTGSCTNKQTALNWYQGGTPVVQDANGQALGTLMMSGLNASGFAPSPTAVFNSQLSRVVYIGISAADNTSLLVGYPDGSSVGGSTYDIYFQSSDCTGQAYVVSQGPALKTLLLSWQTSSGTQSYDVVADNAQPQSFTANSQDYAGTCQNGAQLGLPHTVSGAYQATEVSLPFSVPVATPLQFN